LTPRPWFVVSSTLSAILVVWLGISTLSWATSIFSIWTAEDARRVRVLSDTSDIPSAQLLNQQHKTRSIINQEKPFVVLDFIYTRCPTVCNTLGFKFKQLQDELVTRKLDQHVEVLSISFDLAYDSPDALSRYLTFHKANDVIWSALVPQSTAVLESLKQRFGVVVIDDEFGGFTHNAAIYVVENGQLKKIFNDEQINSALTYIERKIDLEIKIDADAETNATLPHLIQASR